MHDQKDKTEAKKALEAYDWLKSFGLLRHNNEGFNKELSVAVYHGQIEALEAFLKKAALSQPEPVSVENIESDIVQHYKDNPPLTGIGGITATLIYLQAKGMLNNMVEE